MSTKEQPPLVEEGDPAIVEEPKGKEPLGKSREEEQVAGNPVENADKEEIKSLDQAASTKDPEGGQEAEKQHNVKEEASSQDNKDPSVEEEVAALLQNLANKPSESVGTKRTRRSARERKSSLYSDYETEFKGNWDHAATRVPRRKNQATGARGESTKDSYNGFNENMGNKITENSKRLLNLLQSSVKSGMSTHHTPFTGPAPSWKPSRLSIAKFIESNISGADLNRPREFETAFTQVAPGNRYVGMPAMSGGNQSIDPARLMSLLSSLTNHPGGMMDDRQQVMNGFSQGMPGAMQQHPNSAMLQSFLNANMHNQPPQRMHPYPPYPGSMHTPPYHH
jgi:hypothetical protein